jgi:ABC-type Fe3+-hydroxamate transport system substrate-binding protein
MLCPFRRIFAIHPEGMRIVSLVPSITEWLFEIGLADAVVGATKFCIHPKDAVQKVTRIGGTKTPNHAAIEALKPDLIIANKEENTREDVEQLRARFNLHLTEVVSIESAFSMMLDLGGLTGRMVEATQAVNEIRVAWEHGRGTMNHQRVAYAIWKDPLMLAGSETYIHEVLDWFGWENVVKAARYPSLSVDDLIALKPQKFFLSSEPYPFQAKHISAYAQALGDSCEVRCVDGECFSWYGSRMRYMPDYVRFIHSEQNHSA